MRWWSDQWAFTAVWSLPGTHKVTDPCLLLTSQQASHGGPMLLRSLTSVQLQNNIDFMVKIHWTNIGSASSAACPTLSRLSQWTRYIETMLFYCWPYVFDADATLKQHCFNVSCLPGFCLSPPPPHTHTVTPSSQITPDLLIAWAPDSTRDLPFSENNGCFS